jgi:hypothetical protein
MSGGVIRPQKSGEHQTVIFTFAGKLSQAHAERWNQEIHKLKTHLETNDVRLLGITIKGDTTPNRFLVKRKKTKKKK